ncbi:hypothetical protein CIL05_03205 [Virgibacillus profundi]|uniref:HTH tetR-type domain-containing protein n=1 Tax=Virgibacillus profundi TaxID=2024555 RepID=A0A2A2IHF7_9BACI|nr:TetR/AcrR family transcriptional regulator [Virgibacillus profundi]PAV30746.1 hypothetical protein CIL05_03205 [Virgibacillus profundi]PXY54930.1 TetR/AcrR family transcriptional regulator [Virgibacillus profundi]
MITQVADVNRATFYAHFSNKQDFIDEMLYELLAGFEDAIMQPFENKSKITINKLTPTTESIFKYIEENKNIFHALSLSHSDFAKHLEKLFHHIFTKNIYIETTSKLGEVNYEMFIHYQTNATLGLIIYWIKSKFIYSKDYMMEQLTILSNTKTVNLRKI